MSAEDQKICRGDRQHVIRYNRFACSDDSSGRARDSTPFRTGAGPTPDGTRIIFPGETLFIACLRLACSLAIVFLAFHIPQKVFGTSSAPIQSLAVLPLKNLSGDPSQQYFSDSMTDELITQLAKISTLNCRPQRQ